VTDEEARKAAYVWVAEAIAMRLRAQGEDHAPPEVLSKIRRQCSTLIGAANIPPVVAEPVAGCAKCGQCPCICTNFEKPHGNGAHTNGAVEAHRCKYCGSPILTAVVEGRGCCFNALCPEFRKNVHTNGVAK
jgi:hypothetical protein